MIIYQSNILPETSIPAVIVDVDGTLIKVNSILHYLDRENRDDDAFHYESVNCPAHQEAINWCAGQHRKGCKLLVLTGRKEKYRDTTTQWLHDNLPVPYTILLMRQNDDIREAVHVKNDLYAACIKQGYSIMGAIEDDIPIIDLWESYNIPVYAMSKLIGYTRDYPVHREHLDAYRAEHKPNLA